MDRPKILHIKSRRLIRNLAFIYWHVGGVILWLQGLIIAGGVAICYLDDKPLLDSVYLAFITALTIGYGDMTPETGYAKVIAVVIGFLGILTTGIILAASLRALEMSIAEETEVGH